MPAELFTPQNIKFNETIICCCICYEKYWQDLRKKSENVTHTDFIFDESIENRKCFRKYFQRENELFHVCFDCLQNVLDKVPQTALNVYRNKFKGGCIHEYKNGGKKREIEEICDGYIHFAIDSFSFDLFKKI